MSRKLVVMLAVCFFSVQASEQVSDKSIERVCQDLVLRLALPKIAKQASKSDGYRHFTVRVTKKTYDRNNDLASIELWDQHNNEIATTLLAEESRDMKRRVYKSMWKHANLSQIRPSGPAREDFGLLNALYDQLPVEQQSHVDFCYKEMSMLLPVVYEHKHDKPGIQNPRKRRLNFDVQNKNKRA